MHEHRQLVVHADELQHDFGGLRVLDNVLHQLLNHAKQHVFDRRGQVGFIEADDLNLHPQLAGGGYFLQKVAQGLRQAALEQGVRHEVVRNLAHLAEAFVHHVQGVAKQAALVFRRERQLLAQHLQIQLGHGQQLAHAIVQVGPDAAALGFLGFEHGAHALLQQGLALLAKNHLLPQLPAGIIEVTQPGQQGGYGQQGQELSIAAGNDLLLSGQLRGLQLLTPAQELVLGFLALGFVAGLHLRYLAGAGFGEQAVLPAAGLLLRGKRAPEVVLPGVSAGQRRLHPPQQGLGFYFLGDAQGCFQHG